MDLQDYLKHDATALAQAVQDGATTPTALLDCAIQQRNRVNPHLNAVIADLEPHGRNSIEAGLPSGPFHGVPFVVKDLLAAMKGYPLTNGSRAFEHYVPAHDAELLQRYVRTGVTIFGKTNTPELGIVGATDPALHGSTKNPWDLARTPGGSSGGSAAAIAAGIVPMASGGDGGGSLRIPASCCGLVGFKASRGRTPHGPVDGNLWYGQVQEGVMSRSVRDVAAMLDATQGMDVGAPYAAPADGQFLHASQTTPKRLKIAWTSELLLRDGHVGDECLRGLRETVAQLQDLGHELVEVAPPVDRKAVGEGYLLRMMAAAAGDIRQAKAMDPAVIGKKVRNRDFEAETWALASLGNAFRASDLDVANRKLDTATRDFETFMLDYDVFLTPTLTAPPVELGHFRLRGADKILAPLARYLPIGFILRHLPLLPQLVESNLQWVAATQLFNITGSPSVSLPLCTSSEGLPMGMMFTASFADDATLFSLAGQLEQAHPWAHRRPTMPFL